MTFHLKTLEKDGDTNTKANRRKHTVKMRIERKEKKKKNNRQNQWNKMEERP